MPIGMSNYFVKVGLSSVDISHPPI
jgi:hypothetical protein